jgi:hypothetical protein
MHEEAKRGWWDDPLICEFQSLILGGGSQTVQQLDGVSRL